MRKTSEWVRDYLIDVYPIGLSRKKNKENKNYDSLLPIKKY